MFYDRTNAAGGGSFYSRTNDATVGSAQAGGSLSVAVAIVPTVVVLGDALVTLEAPLYFGRGSIFHESNFTGEPVVGAVIRYPTTDGFVILPDGTCYADTNSGTYTCWYDEGEGEVEFTVTLDDHVDAYGDVFVATAITALGVAIGGTAGEATGGLAEATAVDADGIAYSAVIAVGDLDTASGVAPGGSAVSQAFPGDAHGGLSLATATAIFGSAVGAAVAPGHIGTVSASAVTGTGNEAGVGLAAGQIGVAVAITVDGKGRAQWGKVPKSTTIWTRVS